MARHCLGDNLHPLIWEIILNKCYAAIIASTKPWVGRPSMWVLDSAQMILSEFVGFEIRIGRTWSGSSSSTLALTSEAHFSSQSAMKASAPTFQNACGRRPKSTPPLAPHHRFRCPLVRRTTCEQIPGLTAKLARCPSSFLSGFCQEGDEYVNGTQGNSQG